MPSLDPLGDIIFWSRQLSEHALFLNLGLEVEPYKAQAAALHEDWEHARAWLTKSQGLDAAKAIVSEPTKNLASFTQEVLDLQKSGKWMGWLFPLFVDHTLRELIYFVARVWEGGLPTELTYCQNITFMREHAEFAAHLIDPSATALVADAQGIVSEFYNLKGGCHALTQDYINLGLKAGTRLDTYFRTQPVSASSGKSVIHPVLAEHVIREGQRFLETISALSVPAL